MKAPGSKDVDSGSAGVVKACLEKRLLINCTHNTVIRLLPAMNLTDAEFEEGCGTLEEVLQSQLN